jgi:hypothetical protein
LRELAARIEDQVAGWEKLLRKYLPEVQKAQRKRKGREPEQKPPASSAISHAFLSSCFPCLCGSHQQQDAKSFRPDIFAPITYWKFHTGIPLPLRGECRGRAKSSHFDMSRTTFRNVKKKPRPGAKRIKFFFGRHE